MTKADGGTLSCQHLVPQRLRLKHIVGKGASAVVALAVVAPLTKGLGAPEQVAVKLLHPAPVPTQESEREERMFRQEARRMATLHCPQIVECLGLCHLDSSVKGLPPEHAAAGSLTMVLEFMELGSLAKLVLRQMSQPMSRLYTDREALVLLLDVAMGLQYLHSMTPRIVHRDLKLENVLLTKRQGRLQAKIADLGLHTVLDHTQHKTLLRRKLVSVQGGAGVGPDRQGIFFMGTHPAAYSGEGEEGNEGGGLTDGETVLGDEEVDSQSRLGYRPTAADAARMEPAPQQARAGVTAAPGALPESPDRRTQSPLVGAEEVPAQPTAGALGPALAAALALLTPAPPAAGRPVPLLHQQQRGDIFRLASGKELSLAVGLAGLDARPEHLAAGVAPAPREGSQISSGQEDGNSDGQAEHPARRGSNAAAPATAAAAFAFAGHAAGGCLPALQGVPDIAQAASAGPSQADMARDLESCESPNQALTLRPSQQQVHTGMADGGAPSSSPALPLAAAAASPSKGNVHVARHAPGTSTNLSEGNPGLPAFSRSSLLGAWLIPEEQQQVAPATGHPPSQGAQPCSPLGAPAAAVQLTPAKAAPGVNAGGTGPGPVGAAAPGGGGSGGSGHAPGGLQGTWSEAGAVAAGATASAAGLLSTLASGLSDDKANVVTTVNLAPSPNLAADDAQQCPATPRSPVQVSDSSAGGAHLGCKSQPISIPCDGLPFSFVLHSPSGLTYDHMSAGAYPLAASNQALAGPEDAAMQAAGTRPLRRHGHAMQPLAGPGAAPASLASHWPAATTHLLSSQLHNAREAYTALAAVEERLHGDGERCVQGTEAAQQHLLLLQQGPAPLPPVELPSLSATAPLPPSPPEQALLSPIVHKEAFEEEVLVSTKQPFIGLGAASRPPMSLDAVSRSKAMGMQPEGTLVPWPPALHGSLDGAVDALLAGQAGGTPPHLIRSATAPACGVVTCGAPSVVVRGAVAIPTRCGPAPSGAQLGGAGLLATSLDDEECEEAAWVAQGECHSRSLAVAPTRRPELPCCASHQSYFAARGGPFSPPLVQQLLEPSGPAASGSDCGGVRQAAEAVKVPAPLIRLASSRMLPVTSAGMCIQAPRVPPHRPFRPSPPGPMVLHQQLLAKAARRPLGSFQPAPHLLAPGGGSNGTGALQLQGIFPGGQGGVIPLCQRVSLHAIATASASSAKKLASGGGGAAAVASAPPAAAAATPGTSGIPSPSARASAHMGMVGQLLKRVSSHVTLLSLYSQSQPPQQALGRRCAQDDEGARALGSIRLLSLQEEASTGKSQRLHSEVLPTYIPTSSTHVASPRQHVQRVQLAASDATTTELDGQAALARAATATAAVDAGQAMDKPAGTTAPQPLGAGLLHLTPPWPVAGTQGDSCTLLQRLKPGGVTRAAAAQLCPTSAVATASGELEAHLSSPPTPHATVTAVTSVPAAPAMVASPFLAAQLPTQTLVMSAAASSTLPRPTESCGWLATTATHKWQRISSVGSGSSSGKLLRGSSQSTSLDNQQCHSQAYMDRMSQLQQQREQRQEQQQEQQRPVPQGAGCPAWLAAGATPQQRALAALSPGRRPLSALLLAPLSVSHLLFPGAQNHRAATSAYAAAMYSTHGLALAGAAPLADISVSDGAGWGLPKRPMSPRLSGDNILAALGFKPRSSAASLASQSLPGVDAASARPGAVLPAPFSMLPPTGAAALSLGTAAGPVPPPALVKPLTPSNVRLIIPPSALLQDSLCAPPSPGGKDTVLRSHEGASGGGGAAERAPVARMWSRRGSTRSRRVLAAAKRALSPEFQWVFQLTGSTGSCMYMSPEVHRNEPYNEAADVFSFGVAAYEVISRSMLIFTHVGEGNAFVAHDAETYAQRVSEGYRPRQPAGMSDEAWQLITQCWHADPLERPSMAEVVLQLKLLLEQVPEAPSKGSSGCCTIC